MSGTAHRERDLSLPWLLLGVIGVGYAAWDFTQWILAWRGADGDYVAARASFHQHVLLASPTGETLAAIACGALGLVGAVSLTRSSSRGVRRAGVALVAVGCPLVFWQVWVLL